MLLHGANLPNEFWFYAVDTTAYLSNRLPKASNPGHVSPLQAYTGCLPNLKHLRKWGCKAFLHVSKERRTSKLQPRALVGIFVGYQPTNNTYRVWVPDSWDAEGIVKGRLYESKDVDFDETWCYEGVTGGALPCITGMVELQEMEEDNAVDPPSVAAPALIPPPAPAPALAADAADNTAEPPSVAAPALIPQPAPAPALTADAADNAAEPPSVAAPALIPPPSPAPALSADAADNVSQDGYSSDGSDDLDDIPDLGSTDSDDSDEEYSDDEESGGRGFQPPASRYPGRKRDPPGQWWVVQGDGDPGPSAPARPTSSMDNHEGSVHVVESPTDDRRIQEESHARAFLVSQADGTMPKGALPSPGPRAGIADDPKTVHEALFGPDAEKWRAALQKEVQSLQSRGVFEYALRSELPSGKRLLPNKIVFKTKYNPDGSVDKHKARVVAKGCAQQQGEYGDTFAPTGKFSVLRAMMSLAVQKDHMSLKQIDVETAFLYAPLEEEVYMTQPCGFEETSEHGEELVWLLKKSIYGLKQSPRNWFNTISSFLLDFGWTQSSYDPCLFILSDLGELQGILCLYVDDCPCLMLPTVYAQFISALRRKFNITDKDLQWCLGVEIIQTTGQIEMRQTKYIEDILEQFQMQDCKPAAVPMNPGTIFSLKDSPKTEEEKRRMLVSPFDKYRALVGKLLYCSVATRPDIAVAMSKSGHVMANPSPMHFRQTLLVARYLKGTKDKGIIFTKNCDISPNTLTGWGDADLGGCYDSRKSTTGYVFHLNGGPVAWSSKLQGTVALSTTEAEYIALCAAGTEAVFLRGILEDMHCKQEEPTVIHEDNFGCVQLTKNAVLHTRTKHIDIRHHKLRELVNNNTIFVQQCSSELMLADILTKPLPKKRFQDLAMKLLGYACTASSTGTLQ